MLIKVGNKIKTIRKKKNMTQRMLAVECDFEFARMSRIETGNSNPTIRTLNIICNALEIPLVQLFLEE